MARLGLCGKEPGARKCMAWREGNHPRCIIKSTENCILLMQIAPATAWRKPPPPKKQEPGQLWQWQCWKCGTSYEKSQLDRKCNVHGCDGTVVKFEAGVQPARPIPQPVISAYPPWRSLLGRSFREI
jgi:hypothetical protein